MFTVGPGDVDQEEHGEVDDMTEDEGEDRGQEDEPGKELPRISWNYFKLRGQKLLLK